MFRLFFELASLAATIPHRRHLCFWAKSSMFANPISRAILSSSGAIPVKRNPNTNGDSSPTTISNGSNGTSSQSTLFLESSKALAKGDVIGVFPEGTSYTLPSIVQVMPGAAWSAIEYVQWARENMESGGKELDIVPVGIVYTNKSQYLSRVSLGYCEQIVF
jgi:glycerol-3-phosphate O-acyltransferase / dihydroxyacetone phosphate acyltransferase